VADPFLAEIRIFPFNFAPRGWAWCDGQQLPISQNTALFSLLGTSYGGDGKSTFALPDLRGRVPIHVGQGPGLSPYDIGQPGGADAVTLLVSEIPQHTHTAKADTGDPADTTTPGPTVSFAQAGAALYQPAPNTSMASQALAPAGGSLPHNNLMPHLNLYFNIALQGVFPQRP
jgi:microcystin-dependent protein